MVAVCRKPRVAFIPTGSELVPAGCSVKRGQTIDGNSPMVKHLLVEYGTDPVMFPIVEDDPDKLREALDRALGSCDAVIVNGGSAVGSEDFNVRIIEERRDNPPFMANLSRIELHRDGREFVARFLDPRKGSSLGAALASNAQRVSPLGEGALEAGSTIEVELLRGEEFIGES